MKNEDAVIGKSAPEAVTTKEKDCIPRYRAPPCYLETTWVQWQVPGMHKHHYGLELCRRGDLGKKNPILPGPVWKAQLAFTAGLGQGAGYSSRANT